MKLKQPLLFAILIALVHPLFSQTIKRWHKRRDEFTSKKMEVQYKQNVFTDFGWSMPDIKSAPLTFVNDNASFTFLGEEWKVSKPDKEGMQLVNSDGDEIVSEKSLSENDIYYDKSILEYKPEIRKRWVSKPEYGYQLVPVVKHKNVTYYEYDYVNNRTVTKYRIETETVYERRATTTYKWYWEDYTVYVLDIPQYSFYSFFVDDSIQLLVYEVDGEYFLQNASYSHSKDENAVGYVLIDNNINGDFTDENDGIMFNTWNPFSKESSFKKSSFFKENSWYDMSDLESEYFISTSIHDDQLLLDYKNEEYVNEEKLGKLNLINKPEDAYIIVNGISYSRKRKATFKSEYGLFKIIIRRPGYLDFETSYEINDDSPSHEIIYKETMPAANFKLTNIFISDFTVTVTNEQGYSKSYNGEKEILIPEGECKLEISSSGHTIEKQINSKGGEDVVFDFEAYSKEHIDESEEEGVEE